MFVCLVVWLVFVLNAERSRVAVLWIYGVSLIKKPPKLAGEGSSVNRDFIQHTWSCDVA